jgi:DNA (cytosine-5)-methyltransferase 3A
MIKLLIGGSPCTYWSIAQTKNRETEASGLGWELFKNYLISREKYKPDYFLYENNKSMSAAIRAQITEELGVEPVLINSALVSAQSRQRLYWVGKRNQDGTYSQVEVEQPEDRGILLRDILESGVCWHEQGGGPTMLVPEATKKGYCEITAGDCVDLDQPHSKTRRGRSMKEKSNCLTTSCNFYQYCGTVDRPIYRVVDGYITINGERYQIKLLDGCHIIRKLTVTECKRLQTVPDNYEFPVSDTQAYKMLGNGWTVDVIAHIMSHFDGLTKEPVEVLSMYDGMSCGHIALDKLGAEVTAYYATEIDKYAVQTTQHNFSETIQLGDAFQVREKGWTIKGG